MRINEQSIVSKLKREYRRIKGHWWFIRTFGPITAIQYMRVQKVREAEHGKFDPKLHGELMLRAVGASEEQIADAKSKGLA